MQGKRNKAKGKRRILGTAAVLLALSGCQALGRLPCSTSCDTARDVDARPKTECPPSPVPPCEAKPPCETKAPCEKPQRVVVEVVHRQAEAPTQPQMMAAAPQMQLVQAPPQFMQMAMPSMAMPSMAMVGGQQAFPVGMAGALPVSAAAPPRLALSLNWFRMPLPFLRPEVIPGAAGTFTAAAPVVYQQPAPIIQQQPVFMQQQAPVIPQQALLIQQQPGIQLQAAELLQLQAQRAALPAALQPAAAPSMADMEAFCAEVQRLKAAIERSKRAGGSRPND